MNSESLNNGRAIPKLLRASLCSENIKCIQHFLEEIRYVRKHMYIQLFMIRKTNGHKNLFARC